MTNLRNSLAAVGTAMAIGVSGCGSKHERDGLEGLEVVVTKEDCKKKMWYIFNDCTTNLTIKDVPLGGKSNYSIAKHAGKEDTGNVIRNDVQRETKNTVEKINDLAADEAKKNSSFATDFHSKVTSLTLNGKAIGTSSPVGNMSGGIYPEYGLLGSSISERVHSENSINAKARCVDTIKAIGKGVSINVKNQVVCEGKVIQFTKEEVSVLLVLGGWLEEYDSDFRGLNMSNGIIAFSYIKAIQEGKIANDIIDPEFIKYLERANEIINSKHYTDINGVKADIDVEIKKNVLNVKFVTLISGLILSVGIGIGRFIRRRRDSNIDRNNRTY